VLKAIGLKDMLYMVNMNKIRQLISVSKGYLMVKLRSITLKQFLSYFLFFCGLTLAIILAIPLCAGSIGFIWGSEAMPSATASIQLAIVSTALGAVVLWYVAYLRPRYNQNSDKGTQSERKHGTLQRRSALTVGTMLLFAAMCFTLFALLCPLIPVVKGSQDFFSIAVRVASLVSFIMGTVSLGVSLCVGLFHIVVWAFPNE